MSLPVRQLITVTTVLWVGAAAALETISYSGRELQLREQARVCHLGFIPVYDAYLYGMQQERDADSPAATCVKLVYNRSLDAGILEEGTRKLFEHRHGDAVTAVDMSNLDKVAEIYEDVEAGDNYTFCIDGQSKGALMHNGREVLVLHDRGFAERYLGLWIDGLGTENPRWAIRTCG